MSHFFKEHFFGGGGGFGEPGPSKEVDTEQLYKCLNVSKTAT
jgi:hypothetical protein